MSVILSISIYQIRISKLEFWNINKYMQMFLLDANIKRILFSKHVNFSEQYMWIWIVKVRQT